MHDIIRLGAHVHGCPSRQMHLPVTQKEHFHATLVVQTGIFQLVSNHKPT